MSLFCNTFLYRKTIKHLHTILHNLRRFRTEYFPKATSFLNSKLWSIACEHRTQWTRLHPGA